MRVWVGGGGGGVIMAHAISGNSIVFSTVFFQG